MDEEALIYDKKHSSLGKEHGYKDKREPDFPVNLNINLTKKLVQRSKKSPITTNIEATNNYPYLVGSKKKKSAPKVQGIGYQNLIKLPNKDWSKKGNWVNSQDSVGGRNSIKDSVGGRNSIGSNDNEKFNVRLSNGSQIINGQYIVDINNIRDAKNTNFRDGYTTNSQEDFRLSSYIDKSIIKSSTKEDEKQHEEFREKSRKFLENREKSQKFLENLKSRDKALKNSINVRTEINKAYEPDDDDAKSEILPIKSEKRKTKVLLKNRHSKNNSVDLEIDKVKNPEIKVNVKTKKRKETMELPFKNVPIKIASPKQSSHRTCKESQSVDMDIEIKEAQKLIASLKDFFMNSSIGEV